MKLEELAEQLTKLTTTSMVEEQDKIIAGHSSILQEINSKLTVTEKHDSPISPSRGKSPLTPNYYHPESLLLTDAIPRHKPHQTQWHGRNHFVRRLHYAAGEIRSYTLYFPMHRTLCSPVDGPRFAFPVLGLDK